MADSKSQSLRKLKYPDEIVSLSMFHKDVISREEAEKYVLRHSKGLGSYIVRPSSENDSNYVSISIRQGFTVNHVRVYIERNHGAYMYYLLKKTKFSTFRELLNHYSKHRIHCSEGIDNLRLLIPIEKIRGSAQKCEPVNSNGRDSSWSSGSSSLEEIRLSPTNPKINISRDKTYSHLELPAELHDVTFAKVNQHLESRIRSLSQPAIPRQSSQHQLVYASLMKSPSVNFNDGISDKNDNSSLIKKDTKRVMMYRPQVPLPRNSLAVSDDDMYYSNPKSCKNFFVETYEFLKYNERCVCGLRLEDSRLPLGWTIHCCKNPETPCRIFFQHGEITTWEMPIDVVDLLTAKQLEFIIWLFCENQQPMPRCLRKFHGRVLIPAKTDSEVSCMRSISAPSTSSGASLSSSKSPLMQHKLVSSAVESQQSANSIPQSSVSQNRTFQESNTIEHGFYEATKSLLVSEEATLVSSQPNQTSKSLLVSQEATLVSSQPNQTSKSLLMSEEATLVSSQPNQTSESNERPSSTYIIYDSDKFANKFKRLSFNSIPSLIIPTKAGSPTIADGPTISSVK